jgi:regulator of sigma E protease
MLVIYTIIILCVLIFVHELGHFIAAKASGVKVNEFALGMGPAIFKRQRGETVYSLRALPIGGFCAMEGEDEESIDTRSFQGKPARVKAFILAAGSAMNVILAILIMSAIILYGGTSSNMDTTEIRIVGEGSPAQVAGIMPGDKISSIDGSFIGNWDDIIREISGAPAESVTLEIVRDGNTMTITAIPILGDDGIKRIGISPPVNRNPFKALYLGTRACYDMLLNMFDILGQLFTGSIPATELTGPVGIAYIVDDTAKMGFRPVLFLVALISLNLAIVNLLPFPALDGGRLLFLVIRKIAGRAISDMVEAKIHLVGMMFLFALMIYITWNDIGRFIIGSFG